MINAYSIPELLISYKGNISAVARAANTTRVSVRRYLDDPNCERHAVINGKLMTWTVGTSKGFCQRKQTNED
ncbi:MAG: hypothetical protein ACRDCE_12505 [Cetobacterium sp.]|uniref:hypothetical protein n=1 Tax=Cetobacterium sp. TaxID=2071632 RepID=UPI003EE4B0E1